ncbi:MAG: hypothetical protein H6839_01570 [Planctomycetes bacterium]|nr:hypothetical protein [Planctomycetota bacterium]
MSTRTHNRGAALMMVMVILALLLILAVSFTFLMSQQEGTSVASLGGEQTRIITRTGADHAYARLNQRNRLNEFARWYGMIPSDVTNDDDPFVDGYDESVVDLLYDLEQQAMFPGLIDSNGNPLFRVEDPRSRVIGMNVLDESGKINLNSATVATIGNLIGASTVQSNVSPIGGVYEEIVLEDASFLDAYDSRGDDQHAGGYVVVDNQLMAYSYRRGNVLYNVVANPPYNGAGGVNALFTWGSEGREIQTGEYVTTPTAYKIAYYSWLESVDGMTPALFNGIGDVRRISEMAPWFNLDVSKGPADISGWPEGLDPVTYQWLQENATVISPTEHFDSGWCYPHVVIVGDMVPMGESGKDILQVSYDDQIGVQQDYYVPFDPRRITNVQNNQAFWSGIGRGAKVRLRRLDGGKDTILGMVLNATPGRAAQNNQPARPGVLNICVLGGHTINQNEAWVIEVAERASININTANIDTLAAVFQGVGPRGQSATSGPISRADAYNIAGRILGDRTRNDDPFTDLDDLIVFLTNLSQEEGGPITSEQINQFANQQRFPYAPRNQGAVTAQFRYDTLDTYMVDAFATRYQPGGGAMARDAFREWVQVGSDRVQTYSWYTYQQMQAEMRIAQGNILQLHPAGTYNQRQTGLLELPYLHYLADERLVRPWRGAAWAAPTPRNVYAMAVDTNQRKEKFYSNIVTAQPTPTISYEAGDLEAGMFSFWYRPQWTDHTANHYLFDVAETEYSNRMSMLWWGDRKGAHRLSGKNNGLVLRIKDRSLQEAYTELRFELDAAHFRPNDWYHMALNWKGTELSHINLLLDGDAASTAGGQVIRPVVNHTFRQSNGAWYTLTTDLKDDLENTLLVPQTTIDLPIDAQDIPGFPARGVIVIGSEAIEYNGNNNYALQNIQRGARGTTPAFHPRGSKITVFGYTSPLMAYQQQNNANQTWRPRFPLLPKTTGLLSGDLGVKGAYRVTKLGSANSNYFRPEELGPDAGFGGSGDTNPNLLPLDSYAGLQDKGVVLVIGQAWIGYFPPGTQGIPQGGVSYPRFEGGMPADDDDASTIPAPPARTSFRIPASLQCEYVYYDGITANGLNVVARYDRDFNRKDPANWWHFMGTYPPVGDPNQLVVPAVPPGNPNYNNELNSINFFARGSLVIPVSIGLDNVAGYHNRSIAQIDSEWMFYNRVWDPSQNIDATGATLTGDDDNFFPGLLFVAPFPNANQKSNAIWGATGWYGWVSNLATNDTQNIVPRAPWRGACGTTATVHASAVPVIPTFGTTIKTGEGDVLTLVAGKNQNKIERQIRVQRPLTPYGVDWIFMFPGANVNWNVPGTEYICGLSDHVNVDYQPNTGNPNNANYPYQGSNLCKFPTGELPVELPTMWTFAGADPRTLDGGTQGTGLVNTADFDSFEFRMYTKGNFRLVSDMTDTVPANSDDLQVNTQLPPNMGVVHVDNELIAYRGTEVRQTQWTDPVTGQIQTINTYWLLDITRGILGTSIEAHAGGTPIMNMASLRVGRPNSSGTVNTSFIQTVLGEETFKPYGFIRVEEENGPTEILGYQRYQELQVPDPNNVGNTIRTGNINCGMYNNPDDLQALFRGAYGTRAINYTGRALFFDQPVRFPDWFPGYHSEQGRDSSTVNYAPFHTSAAEGVPGAASPEITHFQGSAAFRNSVFTEFKWRVQFAPLADMSRHMDAIGARLVVRFKQPGKPMPEWNDIPTNRPDGLYAFDFDPGLRNTEDLGSTLYEQTQDFTKMPSTPYGVRADRIEWRVYFYFKQNAFVNEDYKTTLQFQGAEVTLNQLTRVVRHEEKR